MVEKPVFHLKIKHFHGCGVKQFCGALEFFKINLKTNNATLKAQEGVIVQITYSFILK